MVRKYRGKVSGNSEDYKFPECEPFNREFLKFQEESQLERNSWYEIFEKLGLPREIVHFFCKNVVLFVTGNSRGVKWEDLLK